MGCSYNLTGSNDYESSISPNIKDGQQQFTTTCLSTKGRGKATSETCLNEYQMAKSVEEYHDRLSQRQRLFAENVGWYVQGNWVTDVDYSQNVIRIKPEGYLPVLGTHPQSLLEVYMLDNNKMLPCLWILLLHLQPWK